MNQGARLGFRLARADDLSALLRLLADDDVARSRGDYVEQPSEALEAAMADILASRSNELWVAVSGSELVGTMQLTFIPGLSRGGMKRALVEAVRVRADQRGRRIGEQLMQIAEDRARAQGCGLIQLTTDKRRTDAHRFYERLGYTASHEGMKKSLV